MRKKLFKRLTAYCLVIAMGTVTISGCGEKEEEAATEEQAEGDNAVNDAIADTLGQDANQNASQEATVVERGQDEQPAEQEQTAIAERSPVEITRIEMDDPSVQSTASDLPGAEEDKTPAPNLFQITECQVEINGIYLVKMAKDLLKEINKRRAEYGISPLKQNTSLLACADSRCKEQTYFIGHFRPDGSPFTSVSPEGYVKGECISVHFLGVNDIMEDWFSVNRSRMQIMNPDYTQCGISIYDINGTYFLAAEFSY